MTYDKLLEALREYFSDTSRTPGQTKSGLIGISGEALMMADTIDDSADFDDDA